MKIKYNKPFIVGKELAYITEAVEKNRKISGDGTFTQKCQEWLKEQLGCTKVLLTHSCTAALEMAAILADISPGDEIIMPSFTFVSTANAFVLRGGVPVFVDIREDTLNIDETAIENALTKKTRAIVPVHYAGMPCAMDQLMACAKKNNVLVIEDAAQALLSSYKEKKLGAIGNLGALSFHETKNVISGEGGALLINDAQFAKRAEIIWEKGTNRKEFFRGEVDKYTWVDIGSSFLPSDIIAAFLWAQLENAESIIADRKKSFKYYRERLLFLESAGFLRLPFSCPGHEPNGHIFYLLTKTPAERERLLSFLLKKGIRAIFHYVPLHSSPAGKRYSRTHCQLKKTESVSARIVRLPLYYNMSENDLAFVCDAVAEFYKQ